MHIKSGETTDVLILVTPHFNLTATAAFLDPLRVANYLTGKNLYKWQIVSMEGGDIAASNGMVLTTHALSDAEQLNPSVVLVSSSWTPEAHLSREMIAAVLRLSKSASLIGGVDTGAFILAKARLLNSRTATVHYEHIDAFKELYPDVEVTEKLFTFDRNVFTCCGGIASVDAALSLVRKSEGEGLANAAARYLFHHSVRDSDASQNPPMMEPFGQSTPALVRKAIALMEAHLEDPLTIPQLCAELGKSQRHMSRLFARYVGQSPVLYYRDIRLDRARGLVTQTEMKLSEIAVASGFTNQVHFSRAYRQKFGLSPTQDRIEGRVPFEFRAWPLHRPQG